MLELVIEKAKSEYHSFREEVSKINEGYQFGKYLANDIRQRTKLVAEGMSDHLNEIAIVLQLGEYHLAWEDVRLQDGNPYSLGVVLYGISHKKDDRMITDFWNHLKSNMSDSKVLPE